MSINTTRNDVVLAVASLASVLALTGCVNEQQVRDEQQMTDAMQVVWNYADTELRDMICFEGQMEKSHVIWSAMQDVVLIKTTLDLDYQVYEQFLADNCNDWISDAIRDGRRP